MPRTTYRQLRIGLQAMGLKELRLELDCSGAEDRVKAELSVDRVWRAVVRLLDRERSASRPA